MRGDCRRRRQALRRHPRQRPLDGSPASAVVPRDSGRRDFAAATAGLIEGVLDDDDGGAVAHLASALVEPDVPAAAAQFFAAELLPRLLARELRGASQRRCARIWLTAIALLERLAREPEPEPDRGGVGVGVGGGRVSPLGVGAVLNDVLPAAATAMLELVASSCGDGLDHQATSAAAALFEYVGARLQEAAARDDAIGRDVAAPAPVPSVAASAVAKIGDDGGESRRKRRRRMMGDGQAGRRRPAPATTAVGYFPFPGAPAASSSYFPFPGAPAVNPAEKQEEDDEEDEEDEEDEDDEDDENDEKNEVGVEERARADAEARRRRLQSTERRRADEVAGAFSSPPPPLRVRRVRATRSNSSRRASRAPRPSCASSPSPRQSPIPRPAAGRSDTCPASPSERERFPGTGGCCRAS